MTFEPGEILEYHGWSHPTFKGRLVKFIRDNYEGSALCYVEILDKDFHNAARISKYLMAKCLLKRRTVNYSTLQSGDEEDDL